MYRADFSLNADQSHVFQEGGTYPDVALCFGKCHLGGFLHCGSGPGRAQCFWWAMDQKTPLPYFPHSLKRWPDGTSNLEATGVLFGNNFRKKLNGCSPWGIIIQFFIHAQVFYEHLLHAKHYARHRRRETAQSWTVPALMRVTFHGYGRSLTKAMKKIRQENI